MLYIFIIHLFEFFFPNIYAVVINCLYFVLIIGSHCQGTKNWICIMTDVKMVEG